MRKIFATIAAVILFISCSPGFCQTNTSREECSAIVEADGYAYLSEEKTIKESHSKRKKPLILFLSFNNPLVDLKRKRVFGSINLN